MELWRRWSGQRDDDGNDPLDDTSVTNPPVKKNTDNMPTRSFVSTVSASPSASLAHQHRDGRGFSRPVSRITDDLSSLPLLEKIQKKIERYAVEERNIDREIQRITLRLEDLKDRSGVLEERMTERIQSFHQALDQSKTIASRLRDREEDLTDAVLAVSLQLRERKLAVGPLVGELNNLRAISWPQEKLLEAKRKYAVAIAAEITVLRARRIERLSVSIANAGEIREQLKKYIDEKRNRRIDLVANTLDHAVRCKQSIEDEIASAQKSRHVLLQSAIDHAHQTQFLLKREIATDRRHQKRLVQSALSHAKSVRISLQKEIVVDRKRQKECIQSTLAHAKSTRLVLRREIAEQKKRRRQALENVYVAALEEERHLTSLLLKDQARKEEIATRLKELSGILHNIAVEIDERLFTVGHLLQLREDRLREIAEVRLDLLARQQRLTARLNLRRQTTHIVSEERRLQGVANKIDFAEQAKQRLFTRLKSDHLRLVDQRRKGLIRLRNLMIQSEPTSELSDLSLLIKSLEERAASTEKDLARLEKSARKTMVRWKDLRRELLEELILQETFSPVSVSHARIIQEQEAERKDTSLQEQSILPQTLPPKKPSRFTFWKKTDSAQPLGESSKSTTKKSEAPDAYASDNAFAEPVSVPIRMHHLAQDWIPKQAFVFASVTAACVLAIIGLGWAGKGSFLQARVMNQAQSALASLLAGKDALGNKSYEDAVASFTRADRGFSSSQKLLTEFSPIAYKLASLLPQGKQIESGKALLAVGKSMATAGTALSHIAERFDGNPVIAADSDGHVQVTLSLFHDSLKDIATATQAVSEASTEISRVNLSVIPEELRSQTQELKDALPVIANSLHTFSSHMDSLMRALGHERQKRYLIFFQNPTELRATGGFPGTYALIDVDQGSIVHMDVNGIYDPANQFPDRLRTVRPDQFLSEKFTFQNANWWPDAPTSAKKMQEMWERAGGPSVDGVLFINATIAIDLLRVTGPLELPDYQATLSADTFYDVLQHEVEVQYDRTLNRPKQILTDAVPLLLQRLNTLSPAQQKEVMGLVVKWLMEKDVQIVLNEERLQDVVRAYGWAGDIQTDFAGDRITLTSINLSGNKSDRDISDRIMVVPVINGDGVVETEVTLTRTHTGTGLWPSGINTSYIRLTVPEEAELISVSGFAERDYSKSYMVCKETCEDDPDILRLEQTWTTDPVTHTDQYLDHGSRVIGNWLAVAPGEEKTVTIRYRQKNAVDLPWFQRIGSYQLLVQKQSGTNPIISVMPKAGAGVRIVEFVPQDQITAQPLSSDRVYGVVLERTWP